jgi:hypothetical protein
MMCRWRRGNMMERFSSMGSYRNAIFITTRNSIHWSFYHRLYYWSHRTPSIADPNTGFMGSIGNYSSKSGLRHEKRLVSVRLSIGYYRVDDYWRWRKGSFKGIVDMEELRLWR